MLVVVKKKLFSVFKTNFLQKSLRTLKIWFSNDKFLKNFDRSRNFKYQFTILHLMRIFGDQKMSTNRVLATNGNAANKPLREKSTSDLILTLFELGNYKS